MKVSQACLPSSIRGSKLISRLRTLKRALPQPDIKLGLQLQCGLRAGQLAIAKQAILIFPDRLSHLLIAACLAYIWMITQGLRVIAEGKLSLIDCTDRRDESLFRLGLDWLNYALKHSIDFLPTFHFLSLEMLIHVR